MLDRVKFWGISLARGAAQVNDAAGWLGTIVLVLGVAAGIAVPVLFSLSPWVIAVVLLSLLVLVLAEGTYRVWRVTKQKLDTAISEIESRFSALKYALQISSVSPKCIYHALSMDVQIGLQLKNNSDEYVRYEVESVSTVIEGSSSSESIEFSTSAVIPPHGTDVFMPPEATGVPLAWQRGSLSLTVRYGHASEEPRYQQRWQYAIKAMRSLAAPSSQINEINMALMSPPIIEDIHSLASPNLLPAKS